MRCSAPVSVTDWQRIPHGVEIPRREQMLLGMTLTGRFLRRRTTQRCGGFLGMTPWGICKNREFTRCFPHSFQVY